VFRVFSLRNRDTLKARDDVSTKKKSYGRDGKPLLVKVHNFESFRAENGYSSLEENDIERVRGQEEVSVDPKPFRFGRAETKTRAETSRSFHSFIDLVANGLENPENTIQLKIKYQLEYLRKK